MNEPTLVVLAAGLGSRYGGLKQIDPVGSNGESLIDFSIYDAYLAGFRKLVLIIRREHEELFDEQIGNNVRPFMDVSYAYQSTKDLPEGFSCPKERVKPWGTAQALLTTKPFITGPFMIINSDDYYGREAYERMYKFLTEEANDDLFGMIGYQLTHTLTKNGGVTRGICKEKNGLLDDLYEVRGVEDKDGIPCYKNADGEYQPITDTLASMNFWGFTPKIYDYIEKEFENFLSKSIDVPNSELVLSTAMSNIIKNNKVKVKMLKTDADWFGVTYPQDKESVKAKLEEYKEMEFYPFDLWY